jgi:hypothetical protein
VFVFNVSISIPPNIQDAQNTTVQHGIKERSCTTPLETLYSLTGPRQRVSSHEIGIARSVFSRGRNRCQPSISRKVDEFGKY